MSKKIQDTISFNVDAETTVTNTTVKFTASVIAVIDGQTITEENLANSVRELLNNFIAGEWTFSNPTRIRNDAGFEEARYTATLRTDQTENNNLDHRREAVNQRGLRITSVATDTSTPQRAIAEAESALRIILLKRAKNQAIEISESIDREFRVHTVEFEPMMVHGDHRYGMSLGAATSYKDVTAMAGRHEVIGHAQKLTMTAHVVLATNG